MIYGIPKRTKKKGNNFFLFLSQRLHGTGIFTSNYQKLKPNVGKLFQSHGAYGFGVFQAALVEATVIELAVQRWRGFAIKGCCHVDGEEKCDGKALLELGTTVDGRNPKQPLGMYKTLLNNGIYYQPQLVSRISSINRSEYLTRFALRGWFDGLFLPFFQWLAWFLKHSVGANVKSDFRRT